MNKRPPNRHVRRVAARRARDYRAGIEAAGDTAVRTIAPMIMRRYFVRGVGVGLVIGLVIGAVLGWQL